MARHLRSDGSDPTTNRDCGGISRAPASRPLGKRALERIERLVALIPPPRANQIRYHGALAPSAGLDPAM